MNKIVYVEDEPEVGQLIAAYLGKHDMEVVVEPRGDRAEDVVNRENPDLVLLDIMLPVMDGWSVLKKIRESDKTPVIMLTARTAELDRVKGLEQGADDYVVKPFNIRELLLRIRAILRRQVMVESNPVLTRHGVSVDPAAHRVTVLGQDVELTATEFRLIEDLLRNAGRVRTREELLAAVWGYQFEGYARTVDTHIRRLRNKLGDAAEIIETVRGVGYRCKE